MWKVAADIDARVREMRTACGWTQVDLAAITGRRVQSISTWERGVSAPPKGVLERLARTFGWPLEIFAERGPRPASVIQGPVAVPSAAMTSAEFGTVPDLGDLDLEGAYRIVLEDLMGWTAKRADLRPAAARAMQLVAALREAARRDAAAIARDRAAVELAHRAQLQLAEATVRELQKSLKHRRTGSRG